MKKIPITNLIDSRLTKPRGIHGLGAATHTLLIFALVVVIAVLVFYDLAILAALIFIFSKWRMLAVKPRYWLVNVRSNLIDIVVSLSLINLMYIAQQDFTSVWVMFWAAMLCLWQLAIKPKSTKVAESLQSFLAQFFGITTIMYFYDQVPEFLSLFAIWAISVACARHFLLGYQESLQKVISYTWGLFVIQLAWVMGQWLLVIEIIPTLTVPHLAILVATIQYALGFLYVKHQKQEMKSLHVKQQAFFVCAIMLVMIIFSNWAGDI